MIREIRKCKHCNKPAKKNIIKGRNKGYLRTCGDEQCIKASFKDPEITKRRNTPHDPLATCQICNITFVRQNNNHTKYCSKCVPDNTKWQRIAKKYGIGKQGWDKLFEKQEGKCCLCDRPAVCVDHDHFTGKVRGLLCYNCNHIVTAIERGDEWIDRAKSYLKKQLDYQTIINEQ